MKTVGNDCGPYSNSKKLAPFWLQAVLPCKFAGWQWQRMIA
jgi:hypothetical protein